MLNKIVSETEKYTSKYKKNVRKKKGQFFTPLTVANFMASKAAMKKKSISILEPGAGNGLLTSAVVKYCIENNLCKSFYIEFVENDSHVLPLLEKTTELIKEYVYKNQGKVNIDILAENYITTNKIQKKYDIIICNPPYRKVRKDSEEAECMAAYVYGQPNLYSLFMCRAMQNLKDGGKFVFITPRSWASGKYYKVIRKFLLENLNLTDLLLFEKREGVFDKEDVLQETLITIGKKGKIQTKYINLYNESVSCMQVLAKDIKGVGDDSYLLLPMNNNDVQTIYRMSMIKDTFESLGYCFKTGPVVEFRNKEALSLCEKDGYIPMFRSANIVNGECVFPVITEKAQYVNGAEQKLRLLNMYTVLLRRLSAKEEKRRLQSCVYYKNKECEYITVENHVNYLVHTDGSSLSKDEAEWINEILMSDDYDAYYRMVNGSTQVNASEINKMPLKRRG